MSVNSHVDGSHDEAVVVAHSLLLSFDKKSICSKITVRKSTKSDICQRYLLMVACDK